MSKLNRDELQYLVTLLNKELNHGINGIHKKRAEELKLLVAIRDKLPTLESLRIDLFRELVREEMEVYVLDGILQDTLTSVQKEKVVSEVIIDEHLCETLQNSILYFAERIKEQEG